MTDAAAYPRCIHDRAIYERCDPCAELASQGIGSGFVKEPCSPIPVPTLDGGRYKKPESSESERV